MRLEHFIFSSLVFLSMGCSSLQTAPSTRKPANDAPMEEPSDLGLRPLARLDQSNGYVDVLIVKSGIDVTTDRRGWSRNVVEKTSPGLPDLNCQFSAEPKQRIFLRQGTELLIKGSSGSEAGPVFLIFDKQEGGPKGMRCVSKATEKLRDEFNGGDLLPAIRVDDLTNTGVFSSSYRKLERPGKEKLLFISAFDGMSFELEVKMQGTESAEFTYVNTTESSACVARFMLSNQTKSGDRALKFSAQGDTITIARDLRSLKIEKLEAALKTSICLFKPNGLNLSRSK